MTSIDADRSAAGAGISCQSHGPAVPRGGRCRTGAARHPPGTVPHFSRIVVRPGRRHRDEPGAIAGNAGARCRGAAAGPRRRWADRHGAGPPRAEDRSNRAGRCRPRRCAQGGAPCQPGRGRSTHRHRDGAAAGADESGDRRAAERAGSEQRAKAAVLLFATGYWPWARVTPPRCPSAWPCSRVRRGW